MSRIPGIVALLFVMTASVFSADFYVDSVNGDPGNDGSVGHPWKSLQNVFNSGLIESRTWESLPYKQGAKLVPKNEGAQIKAGDTIWLRSGDYGDLMIRNFYNTDYITIAAAEGETPRLTSIRLQASSHWKLVGLHVSPEFGGGEKRSSLIHLESHGWTGPVSDIVVEDCVLQSAEDTSQWTAEQWNQFACSGINADGTRVTIRNNKLKNVDTGINVGASHALVENNSVVNFCGDGMRGLGDHSVFQYNVVKNCYDVNGNHDDGFQSWTNGENGIGSGEVVDMVLRGNTIINYEDPDQPHRGTLQGIGCFDGMFVDWVIENNVIVCDHYHGITLGGARGCKIINNTVIDPNDERPGPVGIRISRHKKGMPSSDCIVRNNLVSSLSVQDGDGMVKDHNIVVDDPAKYFVDLKAYDMRLKEGSPAIDAGSDELAPEIDFAKVSRKQGDAVDVGAYEYTGK